MENVACVPTLDLLVVAAISWGWETNNRSIELTNNVMSIFTLFIHHHFSSIKNKSLTINSLLDDPLRFKSIFSLYFLIKRRNKSIKRRSKLANDEIQLANWSNLSTQTLIKALRVAHLPWSCLWQTILCNLLHTKSQSKHT